MRSVLIVDLDAAGRVLRPRTACHGSASTRTSTWTLARRAEEAGFDLVVPRSRMAREMPDLVARLVAG